MPSQNNFGVIRMGQLLLEFPKEKGRVSEKHLVRSQEMTHQGCDLVCFSSHCTQSQRMPRSHNRSNASTLNRHRSDLHQWVQQVRPVTISLCISAKRL